ncbi:M14 family zinc carboxypeptidase [Streptantibioticus cattleyicolor]|uniref:Zinc carboxypeptidase n=1 Tax=Streptantibioticus cattleyicolor (strain ATCC 35852 / DSM 46488 / JCM 4925 / NBRC 14057 / NRRL 8057) TaxID=1003195 RepID=F8JN85_STREN|nr:M14 family zinc carboxypeptidase [Streptantibioticus cattleyicolor]AEW99157.1 peptidase M14 carboxypeptidase A [Streptantibioticus cattleyicolor NRRL 8057 = DSM 46488]CCB71800.1 Predicted carboxypeptidase [Streptantibioticus cattleyicolor NRRL 8057 = DSM 46488]
MSRKRLAGIAAAAAVALGTALLPQAVAAPAPRHQQEVAPAQYVYRLHSAHPQQDAQNLLGKGYDLLERRQGDDLFVLGDAATGSALRTLGLAPAVVRTITHPTAPQRSRTAADDGTFYGGYHTVDGQYAHLDQVAAAHPDLATVVTYGQSWLKQQGQGGHDLKAICITKLRSGDCRLNPSSAKPRFFLMSQIHARELTTGEMSYRWIDALTSGYGTDPAITQLMDTTEMWVVPDANPDGVDIVAQGGDNPILQRKNADDSADPSCGTGDGSEQIGVDLNRNAGTHWGASGTSTQPCSEVYGGPAADSEVENTALEGLFRELYPAVRTGTSTSAPAPVTANGMMITLHSDASMVLFPWEYSARVHTGNDTALRALAAKMASITGYQYGQAGQILYNAAGGTDDWTYDKLGLASFTIEIGDVDNRGCDGFTPPFSCQDSYFWPKIEPALLYAAQHAAAPYRTTSATAAKR